MDGLPRIRDPAAKSFPRTVQDSERASFEAGIALAVAYHYLLGMPIPRSRRSRQMLERGLAEALSAQPFRERVYVRIDGTGGSGGVYSYRYVTPRTVRASVVVKYGHCRVFASLSWSRRLRYPLMRIDRIERG